jgi:hypothetical protein
MTVSATRKGTPAKAAGTRWDGNSGQSGVGPELAFAGATVAAFAAWAASKATLPLDLVMPIVSTLFLVFAAAAAAVAWRYRGMDPSRVTYMDVAGALTLIGICAAATIDPEQMVRLVASGTTED